PIDQRADLYSLGAVIYELLSGHPPFVADDMLELIHATVARMPTPLHELRGDVPKPLSDAVAKLLSKMAEDRYQSAAGLAADLSTMLDRWEAQGAVGDLALGAADRACVLVLPDTLYGRDVPRAVLADVLAASRAGETVAVAVVGPAGAGKTALVNELRGAPADAGGQLALRQVDQLPPAEADPPPLRAAP